jgi:hypothetical protein
MPARIMTLEELGDRFDALASLADRSAGIGVSDAQAASYVRALEFGSVAGERPWPQPGEHTVAAVDPETGAQVVVSTQAPQGFIRVHAPEFMNQLRSAIAAPTDWLDADSLNGHFAAAVQSITARALEEMRAAVPRDSGRVAQSLTVISK